jgi:hypothetical protein
MPSQGIMPGKKTSYYPGLSPAKGQDSPDDEHLVARDMWRSEINTLKKVRQIGY